MTIPSKYGIFSSSASLANLRVRVDQNLHEIARLESQIRSLLINRQAVLAKDELGGSCTIADVRVGRGGKLQVRLSGEEEYVSWRDEITLVEGVPS